MSNLIHEWKLEETLERIGLSNLYSTNLVRECVNYIIDSDRILPLGLEGDICIAVHTLYYSGYTDLTELEGAVTILKEIESIIRPQTFPEKGIIRRQVKNFGILDINKYLEKLLIVNNALDFYKTKQRARIRSFDQISLLQLADPLFDKKFAEGTLRTKISKKLSINDIGFIEDASSSMMNLNSLEQLAAIITGISKTFNSSIITKYQCTDYTITKAKFDTIPDMGTTGFFRLDYYIKNIPKHKLLIIVTDASHREFGECNITTPTLLFNLNNKTYPKMSSVTQIKL